MEPLVSVIIPTYNRPNFLPNALAGVKKQTHKNIEVIVVNDAGSDVEEIVDNVIPTARYIEHKENKGLGATRNTGIEASSGDYICFLDDDDGFYPFHVQALVEALENSPELDVVYSEDVRVTLQRDGEIYRPTRKEILYSIEFDKNILLSQNVTPVNAVMCSRKALGSHRFDESLPVYEDWDMWLKIAENALFSLLAIPTCYYTWREDGSTMSSSRKEFSTELPTIYKRYRHLANQEVRETQNKILNARGMPIIID